MSGWRDALGRDGFVLLPGVFPPSEVDAIVDALGRALGAPSADGSAIYHAGALTAARNVLSLWPGVLEVARRPPLPETLAAVLGPRCGLVRVLYFDKPPEQTWALPWHKDLTVAVRGHRDGGRFVKPTFKAGVPHAEAPVELLEAMLTVRAHLDAVTEENGPMRVVAGSHRTGKELRLGDAPPQSVLCGRGDVLLIRPLVTHASNRSKPGTTLRRRVLHLEFAAEPELPDGYEWHTFVPLGETGLRAKR